MGILLRPAWLVDGSGAPAREGYGVRLEGEAIAAAGPLAEMASQDGEQVVDLPGATLLPGLINNHVHLVLPGDNTPFTPWIDLQSDATLAAWAVRNGRISLRAGVTTVRDCGGRKGVVLDVRNAQAAGIVESAEIVSCGWPITMSGGHTRHFGGEADGKNALRGTVRRLVASGADFVKVMASGGGTPGTFAGYPSFTGRELQAIVETAHGLGKRVSAHCTCAAAILRALEAGVDLIEHAMFYGPDSQPRFEQQVAERIAAAGIPVTPTLQVDRDMAALLPEGPERAMWRERNRIHREGVLTMHALGVPLLAGSDAGWRATGFDTFWRELDELVACGLSPVAAVHAATGAVSRALGLSDQIGMIRPGLVADLVAVQGNLAEDIACLQNVVAVYQRGREVR